MILGVIGVTGTPSAGTAIGSGTLDSVPAWAVSMVRAANGAVDGSVVTTLACGSLLAAMLAGLLAGTMESGHATLRASKAIVEKSAQAKLAGVRAASKGLFGAFFAFLVVLAAQLAAGAPPDAGALAWREAAEAAVTLGAGLFGAWLLVQGAMVTRRSV